MNNRETVKAIRHQVERWKYMIVHFGWKLNVYFHDSIEDMPKDIPGDSAAYANVDFKYLEGSIHFNVKACSGLNEHDIEYVVIHELTHLLVSPLQESSEETPLEYTVTTISRIFQGLREK